MKHARHPKGFTLIELMIVVAIIAILAGIGMPMYSDYVLRGKIAEAVSTLSDMRTRLEQYFQDNRSYVGACVATTIAPIPTGTHFTYACPTLTATTYTITATGIAGKGTGGFVYSLDQANTRVTTGAPTGWSTSTSCWVTKKDGSC